MHFFPLFDSVAERKKYATLRVASERSTLPVLSTPVAEMVASSASGNTFLAAFCASDSSAEMSTTFVEPVFVFESFRGVEGTVLTPVGAGSVVATAGGAGGGRSKKKPMTTAPTPTPMITSAIRMPPMPTNSPTDDDLL